MDYDNYDNIVFASIDLCGVVTMKKSKLCVCVYVCMCVCMYVALRQEHPHR